MLAALGPGRAPPEILRALQEIDRDADLVHLGGDEWLLGVRRPNPAAKDRIEHQLRVIATSRIQVADAAARAALASELGKEFQLLQFCAQGFRPIHLYTAEGAPGWAIVEDFRLRDFNWRTRPEAAFAEMKEVVSFDVQDRKRTERVREFFRQETGSLFRYVMARAKSFLVPVRIS